MSFELQVKSDLSDFLDWGGECIHFPPPQLSRFPTSCFKLEQHKLRNVCVCGEGVSYVILLQRFRARIGKISSKIRKKFN